MSILTTARCPAAAAAHKGGAASMVSPSKLTQPTFRLEINLNNYNNKIINENRPARYQRLFLLSIR